MHWHGTDQARIALNPDNFACMACQRQGEVAQPTEQIQHTVRLIDLQQMQDAFDHLQVDCRVDLGKVRGLELDLDLVGGQGIGQPGMPRP